MVVGVGNLMVGMESGVEVGWVREVVAGVGDLMVVVVGWGGVVVWQVVIWVGVVVVVWGLVLVMVKWVLWWGIRRSEPLQDRSV